MAERRLPLDFDGINAALLARSEFWLCSWFPSGRRNGREWQVGGLSGEEGKSLSININSGMWSDFASNDKGGDLIGLYAAMMRIDRVQAARDLSNQLGMSAVAAPTTAVVPSTSSVDDDVIVCPIPFNSPSVPVAHVKRGKPAIRWTYFNGDEVLGYIDRYITSTGGKDIVPLTLWRSPVTGTEKWCNRSWPIPRPIYRPAPHTLSTDVPVIVVEGEKCAFNLTEFFAVNGHAGHDVVSWVGGSKATRKIDWQPLAGRTVILWPDADGQRVQPSKADLEVCADDLAREVLKQGQPYLSAADQPGQKAMDDVGKQLAELGCAVLMVPLPAPGTLPDGYDCADMIGAGTDLADLLGFVNKAQLFVHKAKNDAPADAGNLPVETQGQENEDEFKTYLDFCAGAAGASVRELGVNRKMVIAALRKAPLLRDCLGFNELTSAPSTMMAWPFRAQSGALKDMDDLALGDWLCQNYHIKAASRSALSEAIETVADQRRFHPIRDYLTGIRHDGKSRIDKWLIHVLGLKVEDLAQNYKTYLELVGRFILLGLVARVMKPGCKFDYSPVFEGLTGMRKSTLIRTLVGDDYFSDTHFDVGSGKDGMEQLEGLWGYELSELTALRKADSEQVKQFFSSTTDRFRGAYGKYVQAHPRQCVIFCSTNKRQYLYDMTGNRRFWPIWIDKQINIDWLVKYRDLLFAEAFQLYNQGVAIAPTPEQEDLYFIPEQRKRLVETAVQSQLYELLTRDWSSNTDTNAVRLISVNTTFVTLDQLTRALGADAAKSTSLLENQIRGWLESNGWTYGRESTGQRRRGYKQPDVWPPKLEDEVVQAAVSGHADLLRSEVDEPF